MWRVYCTRNFQYGKVLRNVVAVCGCSVLAIRYEIEQIWLSSCVADCNFLAYNFVSCLSHPGPVVFVRFSNLFSLFHDRRERARARVAGHVTVLYV